MGPAVMETNAGAIATGLGTEPGRRLKIRFPDDQAMNAALADAIAAGVLVFFSAGNYHQLAGGQPDGHEPTSVWLHKCRADLMTVGACKLDRSMWYYSSRGPGQHFGEPNTSLKPDVVGMTPANGRIVYGGEIVVLPDGWGTSGCCPQVAGLAALMLSKRAAAGQPPLSRDALFDIIRDSAVSLGHHRFSQGAGLIDCEAALLRM